MGLQNGFSDCDSGLIPNDSLRTFCTSALRVPSVMSIECAALRV